MLAEKYRPKRISDYIGHKESVAQLLKWFDVWKPGRAAILHGPPGVGKTSLVYAYASENNFDLVETNASDLRSSKELKETITGAVSQKSLTKRGKIFLFDEVDGISGYEDKGGVGEMIKILDETRHPVVLIANNPYDRKLIELRKRAEMIPFKRLSVWDVMKKLQSIADAEKVFVSRDHMHEIAKKSGGDLRSAINDLEIICRSTKPLPDDVRHVGLREREVSIFDALREVFKADSARRARDAISGVEKEHDDIFWWIENNIAAEYEDPQEVADAYDMLSRADLFRNRIVSRQNWKLLAYMIDMMTAGVSVSKKKPYRKFTRYQYPQNIMILGRTKAARQKAKEKLTEMSRQLHCSTRKIRWEFLPYLKIISGDENLL